jgi:transcriptional regulator with XRE-family HTH domain
MPKTPRIGPKRPLRHYVAEWRLHLGLTQQQLADRLGVTKGTISRWETDVRSIDLQVLAAIAEAFGQPPLNLYRPPDSPSPEELLASAPEPVRREVAEYIEYLTRKRGN